jgi:plastocyanin
MRTLQIGSFFLLLIAVFVLSCGKKSSPTQPSSGGGGGTLETFSSGTLPSGAQYVHTFTNTGSFAYHCTIHGGMNGTVQVVASGADDSMVVTTPGMTFSPSTVTINSGGYVRWAISGTSHTVTRP